MGEVCCLRAVYLVQLRVRVEVSEVCCLRGAGVRVLK